MFTSWPSRGLEVAELEFRHAAAALLRDHRHRDAVVAEHGGEVVVDFRLTAIAVAGRDSATFPRVSGVAFTSRPGLSPRATRWRPESL